MKSAPNLIDSFLIHVGTYVYFTTFPLITSPRRHLELAYQFILPSWHSINLRKFPLRLMGGDYTRLINWKQTISLRMFVLIAVDSQQVLIATSHIRRAASYFLHRALNSLFPTCHVEKDPIYCVVILFQYKVLLVQSKHSCLLDCSLRIWKLKYI